MNAVLTLLLILPSSFVIRASSNSFAVYDDSNASHRAAWRKRLATDLHTAVNVCLFPPLFTFTALYYTDVGSTGIVLLFISLLDGRASSVGTAGRTLTLVSGDLVGLWLLLSGYWIASVAVTAIILLQAWAFAKLSGPKTWPDSMCTDRGTPEWVLLFIGVVALSFRQTNVFWVAVFPIGWRLLSHTPRRSEDAGEGFLGLRPKRFEDWAKIINPTIEDADVIGMFSGTCRKNCDADQRQSIFVQRSR